MRVVYALYFILVHVVFLLALPFLWLHPRLREGFAVRMGREPAGWPAKLPRPVVWFHGASAGDLLALETTIAEVRLRVPHATLVVSTITNSGMIVARERLPRECLCFYAPFDLPGVVKRVVDRIRPDVLVLEYTELWPALVRTAQRVGARVILHNGHFSARAIWAYQLLYLLIGSPLKRLETLCMRDDDEAARARLLGAAPERIRVTGNTKFDSCRQEEGISPEASARLRQALALGNDPVWVAGSTHEGEEQLLLEAYRHLRVSHPRLRLILAPRYIERVERIQAMVERSGLTCGLRSCGVRDQSVIILDTVGELRQVYGMATVVFVGGSFVRRGGQNILEPAAKGKPVLFGPHMENFADSVRVLVGRGGLQVRDRKRLEMVLDEWLARPAEVAKLGALARQAVISVQGASRANSELICSYLPGDLAVGGGA